MDDVKLYGRSQQEIESLVQTVSILFDDICMQIGANKCNVVAMKSCCLTQSIGIVLSSGDLIQSLRCLQIPAWGYSKQIASNSAWRY